MENYYTEILNEITSLVNEKKYDDADVLIQRELRMPYIPSGVEEQLQSLKKDICFARSENCRSHEADLSEILERLHGNAESQLSAVENLCHRNLRDLIPEIQDYLKNSPNPEAAALLMDGIALQEVPDEFVYEREGIEYTFYGDCLTPVSKCRGLKEAMPFLYEWLGVHNPSAWEMARKMLVHEVYIALPLTYEESEGYGLALKVCRKVADLLGDPDIMSAEIRKMS